MSDPTPPRLMLIDRGPRTIAEASDEDLRDLLLQVAGMATEPETPAISAQLGAQWLGEIVRLRGERRLATEAPASPDEEAQPAPSPLSTPPTDDELAALVTIIHGGQVIRAINHLPPKPLRLADTMLLQLVREVRRLRAEVLCLEHEHEHVRDGKRPGCPMCEAGL